MLNIFPAHRCAAVFLALGLVACGGALLVVPLFTFGFVNGDNSIGLSFTPDAPTTESGNFSAGGVTLRIDASPVNPITTYNGSYSGCSFELRAVNNIANAPAATSYSGRFRDKNTIELFRAGDSLPSYTLKRAVLTTSDFGC